MFTILANIIPCLLSGFIIALLLTVVYKWFIESFCGFSTVDILKYLLLLFLFVFYFSQSAMIVGAGYAKGYVDDAEELFLASNGGQNLSTTIAFTDVKSFKQEVENQYPVLSPFIERVDTDELSDYIKEGKDIGSVASSSLKSVINSFIWRRVAWMIGASIVVFFIFFFTKGSGGTRVRGAGRRRQRVVSGRRIRPSRSRR